MDRALEYRAYLKTELWQVRRRYFLAFWGYRCCLCNSKKEVEVHHRTYENLGSEKDTDCVVLCHSCHELHTNFTGNFLTMAFKAVCSG